MSAARGLIAVAAGLLQAWLLAVTGYLLAMLVLGARRPSRPAASGRPSVSGPQPWIALLVPAHDEERGIAVSVASLVAQRYPPDRFEVIVVADNCTDATAQRAAEAGATVWARDASTDRGKGQALAWAITRLQHERPGADAVAVVDADCVATPDLCREVAAELGGGARALQVRYEVSNRDDASSAALRWLGFAMRHLVRARAKHRLGLSVGLFGTGMVFAAPLLREVPWADFSLTEDAEYHVRLVEAGERVVFVEAAGVASAMPTTGAGAHEQQLRWESGNAALSRSCVPRLLRDGCARRDPHRLHLALEHAIPPQSLVLAGSLGIGAVALAARAPRVAVLSALTLAGQTAYVAGGLVALGAPASTVRALADAPELVARKVGVYARIATGRGARRWVRTAR